MKSGRKRGPSRNLVVLTVAGKPLCLVDARRQRYEGEDVRVCDALAHVLLLQIGPLFLIVVINSPWEDSAGVNEADTERGRLGDRKYRCVKQPIGQWI